MWHGCVWRDQTILSTPPAGLTARTCHIVDIRGNSYRMRGHQNLVRPMTEQRRDGAAL